MAIEIDMKVFNELLQIQKERKVHLPDCSESLQHGARRLGQECAGRQCQGTGRGRETAAGRKHHR